QVDKLKAKSRALHGALAEEVEVLLDAHHQMLSGSRLLRGVERRIADEHINAEAAVQAEISAIVRGFEAMADTYLSARGQDVRDVGHRLIRNLTKTPFQAFKHLPEGSVIIAEDLTPADTALLEPERVGGFATVLGGTESHTAIMGRSLGLPAVVGAAGLLGAVKGGDIVVIDGGAGRVIVRPTAATLEIYERKRDEFARAERLLGRLAKLPSVTRDGVEITLQANIELPREVEHVRAVGAAGIGLLRSEFMFMNREDVPDEDEQYGLLVDIVKAMNGRPVTVRTLDIGSDKLPQALRGEIQAGANPALGLRAIRLSLKEPRLLEAQLGAILRAGAHGKVRILLPLIATAAEVQAVREILARTARRLVRRGVDLADPLPPVGAMIEVPGAALAADGLAQVCDFFAIGTNDLIMYTLAIDRGDEQVAHLYNPLHPAVLRLIQFTTAAALRNRIPVSLCGEMAGDPRYTGLLLGLGIRELSMSAVNLPRVKQRVRGLDITAATTRAQGIMDQADPARIIALLDDFNATVGD
ncbi:MAG: phosphoenolpyruvate--protein phosphotransferase, partial [Proteobacteria bacterium]|nr:phosphoenolpyruvate--protein phosphotransferase [Pseudomonadota bacterium]